ncbi:P-loop containing nucleoside triphosphate hydrolase protein [Scleroderma yunnanense]
MLLGPTGAGKSSFVNKAIGNEGDDVEHSLISCTSKIKATRCTIEGSRVVLVDTPGFNHTNISDLEILKLIADWLVKTKGKLLSGLLYFHRISDDFINGSLSKNLRVFQKLCGDNAMSHVVLTTTMWDEVDETFGKERLEELRESDWRAMIERGSRTFRYLNTQESAQELLLQLVGNKRCKLQLQKEMGGNRMQILKTSAARELRSPLGHIQQYDRYRAQQTQTSTKYPWNRPDVSNA